MRVHLRLRPLYSAVAVVCLAVAIGGRSEPLARGVRLSEVIHFAVPTGPKSLRFSPDGRVVVVNCLYGHYVTVIDAASFHILRKIHVPDEPVECAFSHD